MGANPTKVSPLAPREWPNMPALPGVRLGAVEAKIKYANKLDLGAIVFDEPASVAGVFTRSRCPSAPVDWCRQHLAQGRARAIVVNSGNANAFTGKLGEKAVLQSAEAGAQAFGCLPEEVFLASTGVIGEPLDASGFGPHLEKIQAEARPDGWESMARAIMTTDTYHKMSTRSFRADDVVYSINGIAKGAGMIAPDMATMLSFIVTDFPVAPGLLQHLLSAAIEPSFNAITVDSDTSTSDSVLLVSALNGSEGTSSPDDPGVDAFGQALGEVLHELAMLVVRDGEGATKHIEIAVSGAESDHSAKKVAFAIANSPLIKTAVAGEDANWGRVVMAVGKSGEPADRDRLAIRFGDVLVAEHGQRVDGYSEEAASRVMKAEKILIDVELGLGNGQATVWSCDLTADYVAINADYRS